MLFVLLIAPHTFTYGGSTSFARVIEIVLSGFFMWLLTSFIGILIRYITSIHLRMKTQNESNAKLLDGMHEGLLILSKAQDKKLLFSNNPIEKFINAAISAIDLNLGSDDHWLLAPKIFKRLHISEKQFSQEDQAMSLDEIITAQIDEPKQFNCIYQVTVRDQK